MKPEPESWPFIGGALRFARRVSLRITPRALCLLAALVYVAALAPALYIGRYSAPCGDDYKYGAAAYGVLANGGGVLQAVGAAAGRTAQAWAEWQGTFAGVFFMAVQPGVFSPGLYALTAPIMLLGLSAAVLLFCYAVLCRLLGAGKWQAFTAGFVLLFFMVQRAPYPVEAFYWYNGAVFYTLGFALGLALFACLVLALGQPGRAKRGVLWAVCCLLAVCTGGSNYMVAAACTMGFLLVLLALLAGKKRPRPVGWRWVFAPAAVHFACMAISLLAPGNAVRQGEFPQQASVLHSVWLCFEKAAYFLATWVDGPLLVALLFLLPLFWVAAGRTGFAYRWPGLVLLGGFCFFAACMFPPIHATGGLGGGRLYNAAYFLFVLVLAGCLFYLVGWLCRRCDGFAPAGAAEGGVGPAQTLPARADSYMRARLAPVLAGLVLLFGVVSLGGGAYSGYTSYVALRSLMAGEAQSFGAQARQRAALLGAPGGGGVVVPPYTVHPALLHMPDLTADPEEWDNQMAAEYYGKAWVVAREE